DKRDGIRASRRSARHAHVAWSAVRTHQKDWTGTTGSERQSKRTSVDRMARRIEDRSDLGLHEGPRELDDVACRRCWRLSRLGVARDNERENDRGTRRRHKLSTNMLAT